MAFFRTEGVAPPHDARGVVARLAPSVRQTDRERGGSVKTTEKQRRWEREGKKMRFRDSGAEDIPFGWRTNEVV